MGPVLNMRPENTLKRVRGSIKIRSVKFFPEKGKTFCSGLFLETTLYISVTVMVLGFGPRVLSFFGVFGITFIVECFLL